MKRGFLVFMPLLLLLVPAAWAGITYQPDALPEVGFAYDPGEYLFRLTYRDYYLNIQPYAVYGGQAYTLKQIVPFLKAHYPAVSYRQAVQIFTRYHRWGFYLEKLPDEVSSKLEEVGYRLVDTNIPRAWFEVEADPMLNVSRVTIGGRFTLDFSDLEARYDVSIDAEGVHVTGITGLTDLDLDPITYSAPTITVTGTNAGAPWTFLDIYNADVAGAWGVVSNNNGTGRQFEFNAKIVIGDGSTATTFTDTDKQIVFRDGLAASGAYLIEVKAAATLTIGTAIDVALKTSRDGCHFVNLETPNPVYLIYSNTGTGNIYSSSFAAVTTTYLYHPDRIWNSVFAGQFGVRGNGDWYNLMLSYPSYGLLQPGAPERISVAEANIAATYIAGAASYTFRDLYLRNNLKDIRANGITANSYYIDVDSLNWIILWERICTAQIHRQYTFNLNVTGLGGAPIGANVTLTRADGTVAFTALTAANGTIAEQTVTRGYYTQPTGNVLNDYGPFTLTVEADGYLPYEMVNINVNYPVNWSISLTALSLGLEFFSFIMVACAALYYGYTCGDADRSMVSFMFGFLFWLATMVQWFVDQAASPVIILGWVYVFPILLCVYEILMRATAQLDAGTKVNQFE